MQRTELMKMLGRRLPFTATFIRYGTSKNNQTTILFHNIMYNDIEVADHIWVLEEHGFQNTRLNKYDKVSFKALVSFYQHIYDLDAQLKDFSDISIQPRTNQRNNPNIQKNNNYYNKRR